jgi:MYXO-CTERM domain-containing protein
LIAALWLVMLAAEPAVGHPYAPALRGPKTIDLGALSPVVAEPAPQHSFADLDALARPPVAVASEPRPSALPDDLVEQPGGVIPRAVAEGRLTIEPETIFAVEDIPGNAYPRKHTLYLNFIGADLQLGGDISAENQSSLAKNGPYPAYTGGEATALAAIQAVQNDVSAYGITVVYQERPPKTLPYTMAMVGGSWTDTNLGMPAGGVAPIADCGALGQRHVVYVFADGGWGATAIANVVSQEAGHGWGLDHNLNCNSVMSYCGGGDGIYSTSCDGLCESQCQGAAGCRPTHEMFCGDGSNAQNEDAELSWIFGGNEPDLEPPTVEILEPADGTSVPAGTSVDLRAAVDDNYGGFGWRFIIERDGEVAYDMPDYEREVDAEYHAALNFVNLEPGEYTLTVEVMDHYNDPVRDSVMLHVEGVVDDSGGSESADDGGSDGGSDEGGSEDTAHGDGDSSGVSGGETDPSGTDGGASGDDGGPSPRGCACSSSGPPASALTPMIVLLAGVRRRRAPPRGGPERPYSASVPAETAPAVLA